jgi:hypothetical protein
MRSFANVLKAVKAWAAEELWTASWAKIRIRPPQAHKPQDESDSLWFSFQGGLVQVYSVVQFILRGLLGL